VSARAIIGEAADIEILCEHHHVVVARMEEQQQAGRKMRPRLPRQPGPPLQPQPLQRQASSANAVDGAVNEKNAKEISKNTLR
jgi:hypothetical protein